MVDCRTSEMVADCLMKSLAFEKFQEFHERMGRCQLIFSFRRGVIWLRMWDEVSFRFIIPILFYEALEGATRPQIPLKYMSSLRKWLLPAGLAIFVDGSAADVSC